MKKIGVFLAAVVAVFDDLIAGIETLVNKGKVILVNEDKRTIIVPQIDNGTTVGIAMIDMDTNKVTVCSDLTAYNAAKVSGDFVQIEDTAVIAIVDFVTSELIMNSYKPKVLELADILPAAVTLKEILLYKETSSGGSTTDMSGVEALLEKINRKL